MRALILGGSGAVGTVVADELRRDGFDVTAASRRGSAAPIDLTRPDGLDEAARHARRHDVVVNASGVENAGLVSAVAPAAYVDISATASHLAALARRARPGQSVLLGAGLAPGLSTMLVAALPARPGDDVDLAIVLGAGERHGPAAVDWTAGLAGRLVHQPPEGVPIRNLRERRALPSPGGTLTHLRADFPDHLLVGAPRGLNVRSYLAVGDPLTTAALRVVGRFPRLAPLLRRAPHVGNARWSVTAVNRRTGVQLSARGTGQSRATGILTARGAMVVGRDAPGRVVCMADLLDLSDLPPLGG